MFVELQLLLLFFFVLFASNISQNKYYKFIASNLLLLFFLLEFISYYIQGELIDYRFFIHSSFSVIKSYLFQFKFELIFLVPIYMSLIIFFIKINPKKFITKNIYVALMIIIFLSITIPNKSALYKLYEVNKIYNGSLLYYSKSKDKIDNEYSKFISTNNLNSHLKKIEVYSKPKKNIILITLESLDDGFINNAQDLTPNLNILKKNWNYKNIKSIDGCSWSVGSLYCLLTGLPAYFPFEKNKIFQNASDLKLNTLGKIFKKIKYDNIEYFVGESNFVGSGDLLRASGFNVKDNSNINSNFKTYPNSFGFHDKDLFDVLKKRVKILKEKNESFVLFSATINTHLNGIKDKRMSKFIKDDYKNDIEHAVMSLDYLIGDFIDFLKKEKLLDNTSIFIIPDHFFPKNKSLSKINKKINKSNRSLYVMSNEPLVANKDATQLDLSKIILNTAKLKTNTEFFQDNINYDNLNNYINLNSDLFSKFNNENIIYEKPSKEIKITILNDILEIYADEKKIFNLNLKNKETSYINLLFDKNLNFINDEYNKEALVPRKIRRKDEEYEYSILTIFKKENRMINGKILNANDKIPYDLPISDNILRIDLTNLETKKINFYSNNSKRFIAHAGGAINGIKYLNTLEALNYNYKNGFKLFELDLQITADGFIVASHDWNSWKNSTGYKGKIPPLLADFNKLEIINDQTPLDYKKINRWFNSKKDTILITDKINDLDKILEQIKIEKSRIYIEVFNEKDLKKFKEKEFNVIANLDFLRNLEEPISILKKNDVSYISASHKIKKKFENVFIKSIDKLLNKDLENNLIKSGFKIFAYGLNEKKDQISEKDIICKYSDIFYGMYADTWNLKINNFKC